MKIEFSFELKPGTARRIAAVGATFIVLGAAAAVYASQVTFSPGQALTAADLNNNFNELYARGGNAIWKDATGAVMPVVSATSVDLVGSGAAAVILIMPDANGYLWKADAATGRAVGQVQAVTPNGGWYYTSSSCTGTPVHVSANGLVANAPFPSEDGLTYYVIPSNVVPTALSTEYGGPYLCALPAAPVPVYAISALVQVTLPTTPLFTPPARAEFKP